MKDKTEKRRNDILTARDIAAEEQMRNASFRLFYSIIATGKTHGVVPQEVLEALKSPGGAALSRNFATLFGV